MSNMITLNLIQGSEEWLEARLKAFNASEAPVIMGTHPKMSRSELLEAKATCNPKQFSDYVVDKIFAKGHETEAMARPLLEAIIGEELFPETGRRGKYQASFDGITLLHNIGFEHKQWNQELAEQVRRSEVPPYIYWQLEHQLLVCPDLEVIVLVVSDGTLNNFVSFQYTAVPGRREKLMAGWLQFEEDLLAFVPKKQEVNPVGISPDSLPMPFVDVAGQLTTKDNLKAFREGAEKAIKAIKTELITDQDFADAGVSIKWMESVEENIDAAIEQCLARTGPVVDAITVLRDIKDNLVRPTRLKINKLVEAEKKNRRNDIVAEAKKGFQLFLSQLNDEFHAVNGLTIKMEPDYYQAIYGKRSFSSMIAACEDLTAESKIAANDLAAKFRRNLAKINEQAEYTSLFYDKVSLAQMETDYLELTIETRINKYKEDQRVKEEARKKRHNDMIASLKRYGTVVPNDSLSYLSGVAEILISTNTASMEEFAKEAEVVRTESLRVVTARIAELKQREADQERLAQKAVEPISQLSLESIDETGNEVIDDIPWPAVDTDVTPIHADLGDVDIHEPSVMGAGVARVKIPSITEMVMTLASYYSQHPVTIIEWLMKADLKQAAFDIGQGKR